ncbi:hypothetical protein A3Q56_07218, partial [Intoshia linei]
CNDKIDESSSNELHKTLNNYVIKRRTLETLYVVLLSKMVFHLDQ